MNWRIRETIRHKLLIEGIKCQQETYQSMKLEMEVKILKISLVEGFVAEQFNTTYCIEY